MVYSSRVRETSKGIEDGNSRQRESMNEDQTSTTSAPITATPEPMIVYTMTG
jgi:hypothetical protein